MNKVMIDTNVWVDVVLNRPAFVERSKTALMACLEEGIEMLMPATSLKDVFYFATRSAGSDAGYRAIELLLEIATPVQVDAIVCDKAQYLEKPDYEDGIVSACALVEKADAIITRDEGSFNDLDVPKFAPSDFLESLGYKPISLE